MKLSVWESSASGSPVVCACVGRTSVAHAFAKSPKAIAASSNLLIMDFSLGADERCYDVSAPFANVVASSNVWLFANSWRSLWQR